MIRTLLGEADDGSTLDEAVARFPLEDLPPQMLPLLADIAFTTRSWTASRMPLPCMKR
jgi:hypothetical protein